MGSRILLFAFGLAGGLGFGYLLFASTDRAERSTRREEAPIAVEERRVPRVETERPGRPEPSREPATAGSVEREGLGLLIFDPAGVEMDDIDVEGELRGPLVEPDLEYTTVEAGEDGLYRAELLPGNYRITWPEETEARGPGIRVRIEAGGITRASSLRKPAETPIPNGFGRLVVTVTDVDGRPLPHAPVVVLARNISGKEYDVDRRTGGDGTCRVDLRPDNVRVLVGDFATEVVVAAGGYTPVAVTHGSFGAIDLEKVKSSSYDLTVRRRDGEGLEVHRFAHWNEDGSPTRWVFLRPGEYQIHAEETSRFGSEAKMLVGVAQVEAGRRILFRYEAPPTGLTVIVDMPLSRQLRVSTNTFSSGTNMPRSTVKLRAIVAGVLPPLRKQSLSHWTITSDGESRLIGTAHFDHVEPGSYELTVGVVGLRESVSRVMVSETSQEARVRLDPP